MQYTTTSISRPPFFIFQVLTLGIGCPDRIPENHVGFSGGFTVKNYSAVPGKQATMTSMKLYEVQTPFL